MKVCHWEVTTRCNLDCLHCLYGKAPQAEMTTESCLLAIEILSKNGCELICQTGGEPLVRADLPILIRRSGEANIGTAIITNGTYLNRDFLNETDSDLVGICFSVDGVKTVHDSLRGKDCFEAVSEAIDLMKTGNHIALSASLTLTAINITSVEETLDWLIQHGLTEIKINDLNLTGNAWANRELLRLNWTERKRHVLFESVRHATGVNIAESCSICSVSAETICMSAVGLIYPCSELMTSRTGAICSVFDPKLPLKVAEFFARIGTTGCKYTEYVSDQVGILLNNGGSCLLKGDDI